MNDAGQKATLGEPDESKAENIRIKQSDVTGSSGAAGAGDNSVSNSSASIPPISSPQRCISENSAVATFFVLMIITAAICIRELQSRYFIVDEWEFLALRSASVGDLFEGWWGHIVAIPLIIYRLMFRMFGVRSYLPYGTMTIIIHLVNAALIRTIIRRSGVGPWLATLAASCLLFFGPGKENILWGFQISLSGSLAFGLTALLLLDHDGGINKRDWLGSVACLAGILCSGVGLVMVVTVGLAALGRRGFRTALFYSLPALLFFGTWQFLTKPFGPRRVQDVGKIIGWASRSFLATVEGISSASFLGALLFISMVFGLIMVLITNSVGEIMRGPRVVPFAMLGGSAVFLCFVAQTRIALNASPDSGKYLYVSAVLMLPAVACSVDMLVRLGWATRVIAIVMVGVLCLGISVNIRTFGEGDPLISAIMKANKAELGSIMMFPEAVRVRRDARPFIGDINLDSVTVAWLRLEHRRGHLPARVKMTRQASSALRLRLLLDVRPVEIKGACRRLAGKERLTVRNGDFFDVSGHFQVRSVAMGARSDWVSYGGIWYLSTSHRLTAAVRPVVLEIRPANADVPPLLCRTDGARIARGPLGDPTRP